MKFNVHKGLSNKDTTPKFIIEKWNM